VKEGGHGRPPFPPFEGARNGRLLDRYRVWHPFDHVSARCVRRAASGSVGPRARMALCEVLVRRRLELTGRRRGNPPAGLSITRV
jgi:hypothetical protein